MENLKEIVLTLNGYIHPKGDTSVDNERFENLKNLCELVNELVSEIDSVSWSNRDSREFSVKRSAEYAEKFLKETIGICE